MYKLFNKVTHKFVARPHKGSMKGRRGAWLALGLLVVSLFTGSGMSFLISDQVYATTKTSDMTPSQEEQSMIYLWALSACMRHATEKYSAGFLQPTVIKESDASSGAWFMGGTWPMSDAVVHIGYALGNSETNDYTCNDSGWINDAQNLWDYRDDNGNKNILALFCKTGIKRYNNSPCATGSGDFNANNDLKYDYSSFVSNVEGDIYDGQDPLVNLTNSAKYILYRNAFFSGCLAGRDQNNTNPDAGDTDDNFLYKVTIANENGTTQDVQYISNGTGSRETKGERSKSDTINIDVNSSGNDTPMSCGEIADSMSRYAQDYAAWLHDASAEDKKKEDQSSALITQPTSKTTCAISGVGWIVCPVVTFLSDIADSAFKFLEDNFLKIDLQTVSSSSDTNTAWGVMRNIANVVFVIAFLVIILSQVTGFGIDNYGIKKLLPRLVITAILVNMSFLLCQIAVDLSNILGFSLKSVLTGLIPTASWGDSSTSNAFGTTASTLLAGGAAAAIVWANLAAFIAVLVGAVLALLMIVLILIARKAVIIILIVLAPLAFVAFLLPNTEKLFKNWAKIFGALLLLYPIISLVYGASNFASSILQNVFNAEGDQWGATVGAAVKTLPLFAVPMILMKALDGLGNIGATINKARVKASGAMGKGVTESNPAKFMAAKRQDRQARIAAGNYRGARSRFHGFMNRSGAFNTLTGGYGANRVLQSQAQNRKDMADAVAMFGGNDDLVKAWAQDGGRHGAKYTGLDAAGKAQYDLMVAKGMNRNSMSHLAAVKSLSESGKGDATMVESALDNARNAGASNIDLSGAEEAAIAAYRNSGRGDALADLSNHAHPGHPITQEQGWSQVAASTIHREGIDEKENTSGRSSYAAFLGAKKGNVVEALRGFSQMEGRARNSAEPLIIAAAQARAAQDTPMIEGASTPIINNIQSAKDYFGIR